MVLFSGEGEATFSGEGRVVVFFVGEQGQSNGALCRGVRVEQMATVLSYAWEEGRCHQLQWRTVSFTGEEQRFHLQGRTVPFAVEDGDICCREGEVCSRRVAFPGG